MPEHIIDSHAYVKGRDKFTKQRENLAIDYQRFHRNLIIKDQIAKYANKHNPF